MAENSKNVVITGSTRGIGRGMAREFLKRGHNVVVTSRTQQAVDKAMADLQGDAEAAGSRMVGVACNISNFTDVQNLWDTASRELGSVDIWINNAGITNESRSIDKLSEKDISAVPETNLIGLMNGCSVALTGMKAQGGGAIYNFEGFGSNGMQGRGNSVYGSTKYAVRYFTKCLVRETRNGPVIVGTMSPGMVVTDLLLGGRDKLPPQAWEPIKKIFNILADHVETVTPFLVEGVLNNRRHGGKVLWLTRRKSAWRFLISRFRDRDLFADGQKEEKQVA